MPFTTSYVREGIEIPELPRSNSFSDLSHFKPSRSLVHHFRTTSISLRSPTKTKPRSRTQLPEVDATTSLSADLPDDCDHHDYGQLSFFYPLRICNPGPDERDFGRNRERESGDIKAPRMTFELGGNDRKELLLDIEEELKKLRMVKFDFEVEDGMEVGFV